MGLAKPAIKVAFTTVAQGGTLADFEVEDAETISFAVDVDSVAGAPTNFRAVAVVLEDQALGGITNHLRKTPDLTAAGVALLDRVGTTVIDPAIGNVYKKIRLIADFTGGTTPTMTGSAYAFRR